MAKQGPLTKPGSDRIRLVFSLIILRKSFFNNDTGGSDFFFRAACVSNKKKVVSHVSPELTFTFSLKIIAKNYFHLNCTGKFSVA